METCVLYKTNVSIRTAQTLNSSQSISVGHVRRVHGEGQVPGCLLRA